MVNHNLLPYLTGTVELRWCLNLHRFRPSGFCGVCDVFNYVTPSDRDDADARGAVADQRLVHISNYIGVADVHCDPFYTG